MKARKIFDLLGNPTPLFDVFYHAIYKLARFQNTHIFLCDTLTIDVSIFILNTSIESIQLVGMALTALFIIN